MAIGDQQHKQSHGLQAFCGLMLEQLPHVVLGYLSLCKFQLFQALVQHTECTLEYPKVVACYFVFGSELLPLKP